MQMRQPRVLVKITFKFSVLEHIICGNQESFNAYINDCHTSALCHIPSAAIVLKHKRQLPQVSIEAARQTRTS